MIYWTDFHDLLTTQKGICVNFLGSEPLFWFLFDFGNRFWAKFAKWPLFNTLAFRNRFEYRNSDLQLLKSTIFATFCAILVKIGSLTTKIMQGVSIPFGTRRQKSTYHTKYLSKYWIELHQLYSIGRLMYADYKTELILQ